MFLQQLRLENFRCYKNAQFNIREPLLLVTGGNDGGKTALLDALRLLCHSRAQPDKDDFRLRSSEQHERCNEIRIGATILVDGQSRCYRRTFALCAEGVQGGYYEEFAEVPRDETLRQAKSLWTDWKAKDKKEFLSGQGLAPGKNDNERAEQLEDLIESSPKEKAWSKIPRPRLPEPHSENLQDPVDQITNVLRLAVKAKVDEIRLGKEYQSVVGEVRDVANDSIGELKSVFKRYDRTADDLDIEIDVDLMRGLSVQDLYLSREAGNSGKVTRIPLAKLGQAKRRKMQLALLDWQLEILKDRSADEPILLLYDEPDTHFDYDAQHRLFNVLRELAQQPNVQVIVVTHSLNLIDRVELAHIIHLQQKANDSVPVTSAYHPDDWPEINTIARDLGLRNHLILNACLLLTEGQSEEVLIPELFRRYKGLSLESVGVEILKDTGKGKGYVWEFGKYTLKQDRKAFLLVDKDAKLSLSGEKRVITEQAIAELNEDIGKTVVLEDQNLIFLGEKELEDLFSDEVLARALSKLYNHLPEDTTGISADELIPVVADARTNSRGLFEGLKAHFSRIEYVDGEGTKKKAYLGDRKPELASAILEVSTVNEVPEGLKVAFDCLMEYVERGSH